MKFEKFFIMLFPFVFLIVLLLFSNEHEREISDNIVNSVICTIEDVKTTQGYKMSTSYYVYLKDDEGVTVQFNVTSDVYAAMSHKKGDTITIYSKEGEGLLEDIYCWYWEGHRLRNPMKITESGT